MESIRHHLRTAEGLLTCARANLESAFALSTKAHYDPRWTVAIDDTISQLADTTREVSNIATLILPSDDPLVP